MREKWRDGCEPYFEWEKAIDIIDHSPLIDLSQDYQKCHEFAEIMSVGENYGTRGQSDLTPEIIYEQQLVSKLGEMTAYKSLVSIYPDVKIPDFGIYNVQDKRWDSDTKMGGHDIAIKSQWVSKTEMGWTFQWWGDRGSSDRDREIFYADRAPNNMVIFVIVDRVELEGRIYSFNWAMDLIVNEYFGNPKKKSLKGKKAIIYPVRLLRMGVIHDVNEVELKDIRKKKWTSCDTDDKLTSMVKKSLTESGTF